MDIALVVWEALSAASFLVVCVCAVIIFAVALWYGVE